MPATVGIFNIYEQDKFWSQLSWASKKFYNLQAWSDTNRTEDDKRLALSEIYAGKTKALVSGWAADQCFSYLQTAGF